MVARAGIRPTQLPGLDGLPVLDERKSARRFPCRRKTARRWFSPFRRVASPCTAERSVRGPGGRRRGGGICRSSALHASLPIGVRADAGAVPCVEGESAVASGAGLGPPRQVLDGPGVPSPSHAGPWTLTPPGASVTRSPRCSPSACRPGELTATRPTSIRASNRGAREAHRRAGRRLGHATAAVLRRGRRAHSPATGRAVEGS